MKVQWARVSAVAVLISAMAVPAVAGPIFTYTAADLGGGLFEYEIFIDNSGGLEPAQGLILFNANSLFGLDGTSVIGAPQNVGGDPAADWDLFAPVPPFVDQLSYFSLVPEADIPLGAVMGGFTFRSLRDPNTFTGADLQIDLVGSFTAEDIAVEFPEPASLILFQMGLFVLFGRRWRTQESERRRRSVSANRRQI